MTGAPVFLEHPSSLRHETGDHPERPARITAIEGELAARDWLGYERIESPAVDRATAGRGPSVEAHVGDRAPVRPGRRRDRRRHGGQRGLVRSRSARRRRRRPHGRPAAGRLGAVRLQRPPATRPPRTAGARDGVLPVQQRRRRGAARARRARPVAGDGAGLGCAPRKRDQRHLSLQRSGAVRLDPPVAALSADRLGLGRRLGGWHRLHGQPAGRAGAGDEVFCGRWSSTWPSRWPGSSTRSSS